MFTEQTSDGKTLWKLTPRKHINKCSNLLDRPQQPWFFFSQINNKNQNTYACLSKTIPRVSAWQKFCFEFYWISLLHHVKWPDEERQSLRHHINLNKPVFMSTRWSGTLTQDAELTKLRRRLRLSFSSLAVIMGEKLNKHSGRCTEWLNPVS